MNLNNVDTHYKKAILNEILDIILGPISVIMFLLCFSYSNLIHSSVLCFHESVFVHKALN